MLRACLTIASSFIRPWQRGYVPDRPEMNASFLAVGPGLSRRGDLGVIRMTAIAPTLARYLGITLGPEADGPLPLFGDLPPVSPVNSTPVRLS
jgi:hypothetical protein